MIGVQFYAKDASFAKKSVLRTNRIELRMERWSAMSEKDLQDDVQYVELTDEQLEQFSGGDDKGFIAAGSKVDLKCPACWSREVYRMFTFSTTGPYQCRFCQHKFDIKRD